jgi:cysteine desulfurase
VATLCVSAHKLGGPKGAGALIVSDGTLLPAMIPGGQERRRRGGTENIAAIAGFGAAAACARTDFERWKRVARLRDRLEAGLRTAAGNCVIVSEAATRLPNTTCVALPGALAETLVIKFDLAGVSISAGAACSSGKAGASHVLAAMGLDDAVVRSAIRISLGPDTTEGDVATFLGVWSDVAGRTAKAA